MGDHLCNKTFQRFRNLRRRPSRLCWYSASKSPYQQAWNAIYNAKTHQYHLQHQGRTFVLTSFAHPLMQSQNLVNIIHYVSLFLTEALPSKNFHQSPPLIPSSPSLHTHTYKQPRPHDCDMIPCVPLRLIQPLASNNPVPDSPHIHNDSPNYTPTILPTQSKPYHHPFQCLKLNLHNLTLMQPHYLIPQIGERSHYSYIVVGIHRLQETTHKLHHGIRTTPLQHIHKHAAGLWTTLAPKSSTRDTPIDNKGYKYVQTWNVTMHIQTKDWAQWHYYGNISPFIIGDNCKQGDLP